MRYTGVLVLLVWAVWAAAFGGALSGFWVTLAVIATGVQVEESIRRR